MIVGTIEVPRIVKALLSALAAHLAERRRPGEPGQGGTWLHTFLSFYSFSFLPGGAPGAPGSDASLPLCRSSWRGRGTGQGQPASSSPATEEAQAPPFPASELLPHLARQLLCAPPLVCFSGSHGRASSLPSCSWGERRRRTRPRSRAGCLSPGGRLGVPLAPPHARRVQVYSRASIRGRG